MNNITTKTEELNQGLQYLLYLINRHLNLTMKEEKQKEIVQFCNQTKQDRGETNQMEFVATGTR